MWLPFHICFFFLMLRRPPRSTLFPTRRSSDLAPAQTARTRPGCRPQTWARSPPYASAPKGRSEEHTSELQSHSDLVCRLLLEKKKKPQQNLYSDDTQSSTEQKPRELAADIVRY